MTRESITVVALLILIGCLVPQCVSANDASVPLEGWVERLKTVESHMAAAFGVGPELVKLDPDFGLKVVEAAWPELTDYKVKTGLLKAFHFGKSLRPKKHPRVLKILHLGMSDKDEKVRQYAAAYVKEYALEDFSGRPQVYAQWYEKHGGLPVEQVVAANQTRQRPLLENKLREIVEEFKKGNLQSVKTLAREIGEFAASENADNSAWFKIMGNPPMRQIFETAFGLPNSFGLLDVGKQRDIFRDKARMIFGDSSLAIFKESENVDKMLRTFFVRKQISESIGSDVRGSTALTLLKSSADGMARFFHSRL